MTPPGPPRPAWRLAGVATAMVLAGYVISLAPSVTFWDAGEFIATARILGIPHPPGTPLFVLIAHVWGALLPFGEYAARLNLLSALFSACGAGFFCLIAHQTLRRAFRDVPGGTGALLSAGGALAAAVLAGFTFTNWQNSNETEVYAVATSTIAAVCWLCYAWRQRRGEEKAGRILLLVLYLAGLSIGNHLLALLAGPAVVAFIGVTLLGEPAADRTRRRTEWAQLAVVAGAWALLIGTGLGSTGLMLFGAICFGGAAVLAATSGAAGFAGAALVVSSIGVTTYLYLYLRSGLHPIINEAAPENFQALLAVIRRAQYLIRTPLDDPTELHGAENPGRSLTVLGLQIANYFQYFDWQWANGVPGGIPIGIGTLPWRTLFTLVFASLGVRGMFLQREADRAGWWQLLVLFLTTGLVLMLYMNFKPGYSIGYDRYPDGSAHEVRERDYFFVVSFVVWGVWAGMGLADLARRLALRFAGFPRLAPGAALAVALTPLLLNFPVASRRHGPDARLPGEFAYDLLNSVPPYGVLFTYGDNDTFPLWWAQEVAGIRRDVTVVCLALAQTDWYVRQLRDLPVRPFDEASAPAIWRGGQAIRPDWPLHTMTDAEIAAAVPTMIGDPLAVRFGAITHTYPPRTVFYLNDILVLRVVQQNLGRRPIAWSITTGRDFHGLDDYIVQQGIVYTLQPARPDTTSRAFDSRRAAGITLDVTKTERLLWQTYRFGGMLGPQREDLDPTSRGIGGTLATPFTQLATVYETRGDTAAVIRNLEMSAALSPHPAMLEAIARLRGRSGIGRRPGAPAAPR